MVRELMVDGAEGFHHQPSTLSLSSFARGRGRQVMHLPCKQAYVGALPTDSIFNCGKLDQRIERIGLVAQLAEQPVVCGKAEGASPFGSAIFSECSSVFRAPGLGPGGRRWKSCHSEQFQIAAVVEYMRHPSSKRNDAGGNPVGSTIAR